MLNILALVVSFVHSVDRINETLVARELTPLNFGIAVHAGEVIYGNLASDTMIDPTVIGLNVNRTARMEELTKSPAVREVVGSNAVIVSEEFAGFVERAYGDSLGLIELRLDALKVSIRDFPGVKRVYALPREAALAFYPLAEERIRGKRLESAPRFAGGERGAHLGVEYYYEMHGAGPNTTWSVLVNVSRFPTGNISSVLRNFFGHLETAISQGDERWLTLSTAQSPGEYDETDVEAWVFEIIERLANPDEAAAGHA